MTFRKTGSLPSTRAAQRVHTCATWISVSWCAIPFGILPPCRNSSETYAGVAASFARLIQPYDNAKYLAYRNSAEEAWAYANAHTTEQTRQEYSVNGVYTIIEHKSFFRLPYLAWASAELSLTTGNNTYRDHLAANMNEMKHWSYPARKWPYMISDSPHVDETLRQEMIDHFWDRDMKDISDNTKDISGNTLAGGYRVGMGDNTRCGWGAAQGGGQYGRALMMAWFLTEDQQYIDLACFNGDFHLGANPLSRCSLTGMGARHPNRPEISWWLYERPWDDLSGRTVEGIGIYGIGPPLSSYPYDGVNKDTKWPRWYSWRDVWGEWAEIYSEFTISQTVGPQAAFYAMLYGYEKLNGELSRSPTLGTGRGLTAEYYDTNDLSGTPVIKNDPVVNFNWLKGEPIPGIDKDTFSVRWSGKVQPLYSQGYTFELTCDDGAELTCDDGVRLWVGGQLIVDEWNGGSRTRTITGTRDLIAGQKYDMVLEYCKGYGNAKVELRWQSSSQELQIIPCSQLYPSISPVQSSADYPLPPAPSPDPTSMAVPSLTDPSSVDTYEAEDAVLVGCTVGAEKTGYSGKGHIAKSSWDPNDTVTFTVNVPSNCTAELLIGHGWIWGERTQYVIVNDGEPKLMTFPASDAGWIKTSYGKISLNAGNNTIQIKSNGANFRLDCIGIKTTAAPQDQ